MDVWDLIHKTTKKHVFVFKKNETQKEKYEKR